MIIGAHSIIYSTKPDADRAFLKDILKFTHVDVGEGWLIFGLPPAEVAVHPSEENNLHEFYLMCDNIEDFVTEMTKHAIACAPVQNQGWGLLTQLELPSGGKLGVYQPRHARPKAMAAKKAATKPKKAAKKPVKRATRKRAKKVPRKKRYPGAWALYGWDEVPRCNSADTSSCLFVHGASQDHGQQRIRG